MASAENAEYLRCEACDAECYLWEDGETLMTRQTELAHQCAGYDPWKPGYVG